MKEAGRTVAAQIRHDRPVARAGQWRNDTVPGSRVIGKSVQEDHRGAVVGTGHLAGDLKGGGADLLTSVSARSWFLPVPMNHPANVL